MRVVRIERINFTGALTNTYDIEAMGAQGVIVEMVQDEGTAFVLSGIPLAGGLATRIVDMTSGARASNHEFAYFGVPLPFSSVSFVWTGGNARQGRLIFVDEPIRPFGRLVLKTGVTAVAAAGTTSVLVGTGLGVPHKLQLAMSTNQEGRANVTAAYRGVSITMNAFAVIAGVTGGFVVSAEIPGPSLLSLDLQNDDGVNVNTFTWAVLGTLG